eukprot:1488514-Pyramimonas_sp.AAC.1
MRRLRPSGAEGGAGLVLRILVVTRRPACNRNQQTPSSCKACRAGDLATHTSTDSAPTINGAVLSGQFASKAAAGLWSNPVQQEAKRAPK